MNNLGIVRRMQKRFKEAIMNFQRSLQIKEEIGDQQGMANSLTNLAIAYEQSGQIDHAITTRERSLNSLKQVKFLTDYEKASGRLGKLRLQIKRHLIEFIAFCNMTTHTTNHMRSIVYMSAEIFSDHYREYSRINEKDFEAVVE